MNWSTIATAVPAVVASLFSAIALWRSAQHNRAAIVVNAKETHYQTESANWRDFAASLQERLKSVEKQVTNGHKTNMRDDLSTVIGMIAGLSADMREMRKDLTALEQRVP